MPDIERIGRYQILEQLGQGGMARVYRAYDPNFRRDVALKIMSARLLANETFRQRFDREGRTIAALEHRAIVPVYDFGEEDGRPYLVMRLMTGGSLAGRLKSGALSPAIIQRVLDRIGDALDKAHARGIVHRDLKPGNILFDDDDQPYLSDFGIVKSATSTRLTATGGMIGTPAYMSPEQVMGKEEIDGRSDIYALGAVLYEMLTGRQPYDSESGMGMAMAHLTQPVPQLSETAPQLPAGYQAIIDRAMAKEPTARYQRAAELAAALSELQIVFAIPPDTERSRKKVLDAAIRSRITVGVSTRLLALVRDREGKGLSAILEIEPGYGLTAGDVKISRGFNLSFPADESGVLLPTDVEIVVVAHDFKPDESRKTVTIYPFQSDDELDPVEFRLTPLIPGELPITIEVYQTPQEVRQKIGSKPLSTICQENPSPMASYRLASLLFDIHSINQIISGHQVNIDHMEGDIGHVGDDIVGAAPTQVENWWDTDSVPVAGTMIDSSPPAPTSSPLPQSARWPRKMIASAMVALLLAVFVGGYLAPAYLASGGDSPLTTANKTQVAMAGNVTKQAENAMMTSLAETAAIGKLETIAAEATRTVLTRQTEESVFTKHVVQEDETLPAIAAHYVITVEAILRANGIFDPESIRAGQELLIPLAAGSEQQDLVQDTATPTPTVSPTATPTPTTTPTATPTPTSRPEPDLGPQWTQIGSTAGGELLEVVRFGAGPEGIVLIGGLHAGFAPASVVIADNLVRHFSQNPREVPSGVTLYIIPSVNKDSLHAPGEWEGRANANKVDLNRNWDCNWSRDATWRGSRVNDSGGSAPFSEPETRALRDFIFEIDPVAVIFWEARFKDGLISPGKCGGVSDTTRDSYALAGVFGSASHYPVADYEEEADQVINGDANNWLDSVGIPSIAVILDQYENPDWANNLEGVRAVLAYHAN